MVWDGKRVKVTDWKIVGFGKTGNVRKKVRVGIRKRVKVIVWKMY